MTCSTGCWAETAATGQPSAVFGHPQITKAISHRTKVSREMADSVVLYLCLLQQLPHVLAYLYFHRTINVSATFSFSHEMSVASPSRTHPATNPQQPCVPCYSNPPFFLLSGHAHTTSALRTDMRGGGSKNVPGSVQEFMTNVEI